ATGRSEIYMLSLHDALPISQQLGDPGKLSRFMKIVMDADGCIATTSEAAEIYQRIRIKRDPASVAFVPTPYPVEDQRWDKRYTRDRKSTRLNSSHDQTSYAV